MGLKRLVKTAMDRVVATVAPPLWRIGSGRLIVVTYHRVLPRGDERLLDEQPGMVVHPETFRAHLRLLRQHFEPVKLGDWLARARNGEAVPRRACAVTFDDGWRDNYEHAFPILREEGCPATIFLVSDMVGTDEGFWPERLGAVLRRAARSGTDTVWRAPEFAWLSELGLPDKVFRALPDPERLDAVISSAKRYSDAELYQRLAPMEALVGAEPQPPSLLDWAQVREMAESGLVELGSHTRRHTRLTAGLTEHQIQDEVVGSGERIRECAGRPAHVFCYPNGDVAPGARALVKEHYLGACTTARGWNRLGDDPYGLCRVSLHEDASASPAQFLARVAALR